MIRLSRFLALSNAAIAALALASASTCAAATVRTEHVEAELVSVGTAIEPGKTLSLALRLKAIPNWHTYWRNPGDSGESTRITWQLPAGYRAGRILWPVPERLPAGPLMNYGYEGEVFLLTDVAVPARFPGASGAGAAGVAPARATIGAHARWLVCNPEMCVPEEANLSLTLPVGTAAKSAWAKDIVRTRAGLPVPASEFGRWKLAARGERGRAELDVIPPQGATLRRLSFFPYEEGKVEYAVAQDNERLPEGVRVSIPASTQPVGNFARLFGLLVSSEPFAAGVLRAVEIDVPIVGAVGPAVDPKTGAPVSSSTALQLGVVTAMVFAFIGGLILNLMPCVLPVLSIKVLSFATYVAEGGEDGEEEKAGGVSSRSQSLIYATGVLVSFWLLAGLLVVLQSAGNELGWGFQLQSPLIVALLALLFFAMALNLSGVFEFGNVLPPSIDGARVPGPRTDAFLTGVLAVAVASPCTAPFMGAALGYALAQSAATAFLIFTSLGIGMALPYVMLAWHPRWLKWVPKPGVWMLRLEQFLAFPLYATVIWLAWVLGEQAGLDAVIILMGGLLALGIAAWLIDMPAKSWIRTTIASLAALAIALAYVASVEPAPPPHRSAEMWKPWSPQLVAELVAQRKPAFVDFTAAWCVTCQVNKRLVLSRPDIEKAFRDKGVTPLRADWTRHDPEIGRALAALGRNGVPVYALYRTGHPPILLPEILTRDVVLGALENVAN